MRKMTTCVMTRISAAALAAALTVGSMPVMAAENTEEKVLRFAQSNPKQGLDMQKSTQSGSASIADCVTESLLRWNEDNELELVLLTEMPEASEDGLTYSFELKEGVYFSNGEELTSSDVKYSFERMFKPETAAKSTYMYDMIDGAAEMLEGSATELSGFEIQDDYHFTITLDYAYPLFVKQLGVSYACIFPEEACEAAGENWGLGLDLIGTGPYVLVENDDLTRVVLEKNENYHGGEPNMDRIEVSYIDDTSTKMLEYEAGNIDMCDLDTQLYDQYKDSDLADEIVPYTSLGTVFINMNMNTPELQDVRVREAISLAINREELAEVVYNGLAIPASSFLNPSIAGHDESLGVYEYNPEKAIELLEEAGATGLELTAKIQASRENLFVVLQGYLAEVGITLNIEVVDNAVWSQMRSEGSLEFTYGGWYALYADGDNQMYTYYYSDNAAGKSSFYNNEEFDALVTEARQSSDDEARAELYRQADYILSREDYGCIPLVYQQSAFVAKPYVQGMKVGNLIYHLYVPSIDLEAKAAYEAEH